MALMTTGLGLGTVLVMVDLMTWAMEPVQWFVQALVEGLTLMTATDDDNRAPAGGRDVVDQLRSAGALDGLFEQIDSGQVSMTGADGLLPALVKEALERGLAAELTEHLGYDRGEPTSQARGNARNGTTSKTVDSEVGPFEIEVPRDRAGTFTPRLVRKGQRRLDGLDACESPGLMRRWN